VTNLAFLRDADSLQGSEAASVTELLRVHAPEELAIGFIHKDLCAENRVRDESGRVVVVENESLRVGPHAYDLARTWYH
jgi:thiamine kinase-like enzyme